MKVGEENSIISKYLKTLMDLGIVKKETPIAEKPDRKTSICQWIIFSVPIPVCACQYECD